TAALTKVTAATQPRPVRDVQPRRIFEVTANDRRFLRSLRIPADETAGPVESTGRIRQPLGLYTTARPLYGPVRRERAGPFFTLSPAKRRGRRQPRLSRDHPDKSAAGVGARRRVRIRAAHRSEYSAPGCRTRRHDRGTSPAHAGC